MNPLKIILGLAPTIISMLKLRGIDIDLEFIKALEIIPNFISEKQKEYMAKYPDLDIHLMISFLDNEVYLMPVGLKNNDENETVIAEQFEPINVSQFLAGIKVSELINVLKKNPDMPIMEAVEKSRIL